MAVTQKIEIDVEVKNNVKQWLNDAKKEIERYSRDTWVLLDNNKIKLLTNDWANLIIKKREANQVLKETRKLYDNWLINIEELKKAEISFNNMP